MYVTLDSPGHSVTIDVERSWEAAYAYLSDPWNVGKWALGTWQTEATDVPNLYLGTSLFSGKRNWFRLVCDRGLRLIDCYVGNRDVQLPRISMRIVPAHHFGGHVDTCLVTLNAWRDVDMDGDRWKLLCISHEAEILLIKSLIERDLRTETGEAREVSQKSQSGS